MNNHYRFSECDSCRAKPGSLDLCRSCFRNKEIIGELSEYILELEVLAEINLNEKYFSFYKENNAFLDEMESLRQENKLLKQKIEKIEEENYIHWDWPPIHIDIDDDNY